MCPCHGSLWTDEPSWLPVQGARISLKNEPLAAECRATLRDDAKSWHVAGVDVGQLLGVGLHNDHDLVTIGLGRKVGEHPPAERGRESVATASGEVVTENPRTSMVGVDQLGGVGGEVADEPSASTSTGIGHELHPCDQHPRAD